MFAYFVLIHAEFFEKSITPAEHLIEAFSFNLTFSGQYYDIFLTIFGMQIWQHKIGCANKKTKYHILTFLVILVDPDYAQD